ncbi:MAG: hypothetical protein JRI86_15250, partial [Deltaproteobacteria bacterium]|nr:hypothetical protein [Deltaproteobacteria bacterium]
MKTKILMKRFGIWLIVSAVTITSIAGFAGQVQAEKPRYGGILKNISVNCPRAIGWPSSDAPPRLPDYFLCMEPLLRIDDDGTPVPFLATS